MRMHPPLLDRAACDGTRPAGQTCHGDVAGNIFDRIVPPGAYDPTTRLGWIAANGSFTYVDKTGASDLYNVVRCR